jgi:protein-S-isoprenylcysteine O-methyltransferase Ste14
MDTGRTETQERPLLVFMIPPPIIYGLCFAVGVLLQYLIPLPGWTVTGTAKLIGIVVLIGGVGSALTLALTFLTRRTTLNPFGHPTIFIARGPYRFTRNPMYVALTVVYTAGIVLFGSLWPALMLLIPILALDRIVIPHEERQMSATFGASYQDYKTRVRRWI